MSLSKPLIGINADYRSARKDTPAFSYLSAGYFDSVIKSGGVPVVIPPMEEKSRPSCKNRSRNTTAGSAGVFQ